MLYPQRNKFRQYIDLSGFWDFCLDPEDLGKNAGWGNGYKNGQPIAVPASWNDQFAETHNFLGPAWYQTYFSIPWNWEDQHIFIRFGSINYLADIWLNGQYIGQHEGGHLPFVFEITSLIKSEENLLSIRVDGNLAKEHVPPAGGPMDYPSTNFDFFPYCGIHRPVIIYTVPKKGLKDITIRTDIRNNLGKVNVKVELIEKDSYILRLVLKGHGQELEVKVPLNDRLGEATVDIPDAALWNTEDPNLYTLIVQLLKDNIPFDQYSLKIGIRTVEVKGSELLLNGKSIKLIGFAKHIDFPITGRGEVPAVIIKDFSLMDWIGANSFRTSHYPYSEQMMDLADQLGFLVIDEIPAVGLTFQKDCIERHLSLCKQYLKELISRDKNHPSIIIWSLANEPHNSIHSKDFFSHLHEFAKSVDPTRLTTLVNMQGVSDKAFEFLDIICINRYYGWYTEPGRIKEGCNILSKELDNIYNKYQKPIILTEFGADAIPGLHTTPPEMFSEEYQVEFLRKYMDVANSKAYIVGQHIWNMCDFKTPQSIRRIGGMNYKGVFTRERTPKMAAHMLRKLWHGIQDNSFLT